MDKNANASENNPHFLRSSSLCMIAFSEQSLGFFATAKELQGSEETLSNPG